SGSQRRFLRRPATRLRRNPQTRASRPTRSLPKSRARGTPRAAIPLRLRNQRHRALPVAVAVTGGIGAGKSETLRAFARHGAAVISSDEIVHELLRNDEDVRAAVRAHLGDEVFGPDGAVDRESVADVVFADEGELDWLERLLHPR